MSPLADGHTDRHCRLAVYHELTHLLTIFTQRQRARASVARQTKLNNVMMQKRRHGNGFCELHGQENNLRSH